VLKNTFKHCFPELFRAEKYQLPRFSTTQMMYSKDVHVQVFACEKRPKNKTTPLKFAADVRRSLTDSKDSFSAGNRTKFTVENCINQLVIYCLTGTGMKGLMRCMATLPQGNQELLVVREKLEDPQVSLG